MNFNNIFIENFSWYINSSTIELSILGFLTIYLLRTRILKSIAILKNTLSIICYSFLFLISYMTIKPFLINEHSTYNLFSEFELSFVEDSFTIFCKFFIFVISFICICLFSEQRVFKNQIEIKANRTLIENYENILNWTTLTILMTTCFVILVSTTNCLIFILVLECVALIFYVICSKQESPSSNSKIMFLYYAVGGFSALFLLIGLFYIYASAMTLNLTILNENILKYELYNDSCLIFGVLFFLFGLFIKLAFFPAHFWIPEVYEGCSILSLVFLMILLKFSIFVFLLRFLFTGIYSLALYWKWLCFYSAIGCLYFGTTFAAVESNINKFLAGSSITQTGFLLLGLACADFDGLVYTIFYLVVYLINLFMLLVVILKLNTGYRLVNISDFRNLITKEPFWACLLTFILLNLAGFPPTIGFFIKYNILNILSLNGVWETIFFYGIFFLYSSFYYLKFMFLVMFGRFDGYSIHLLEINKTGKKFIAVFLVALIVSLMVYNKFLLILTDNWAKTLFN